MKKITIGIITSLLLGLASVATADPVSVVWNCKLNDGKTREDAQAVNAKWLKWARATGGTDAIESSFVTTVVGNLEGFMWVDTYPDLATFAKVFDADSGLDDDFNEIGPCSHNSMYRGERTEPAK